MKIEKLLNWFESEKKKDEKELNRFKKTTIQEIKGLSKRDLFYTEPKKLTLWQRLRKTLMGY
jgi:hypothetical protein